jgi:uncharacterized membrane protein YgaE (UPF0421/DUF939 family)
MITLSIRSKEAIKTGLAMAITYGIALQLGWEKPSWAGMAVAMISLSTAGQSLNKGAMRMLGTLVGLKRSNIDIAAKRHKKHKNKISELIISMSYYE